MIEKSRSARKQTHELIIHLQTGVESDLFLNRSIWSVLLL